VLSCSMLLLATKQFFQLCCHSYYLICNCCMKQFIVELATSFTLRSFTPMNAGHFLIKMTTALFLIIMIMWITIWQRKIEAEKKTISNSNND
jgi:hypothetical protein